MTFERRYVLVVEDDPGLQRAMASTLVGAGFEVATAPDYATAVRVLASRTPTLVCVDWRFHASQASSCASTCARWSTSFMCPSW